MLKWVFGADTAPFKAAVHEMRSEVKEFSGSAKEMMLGVFGGAALIEGAKAVIEHFGRIQKLAERFGDSAESVQRVSEAAKQAGMDVEQLAKVMTIATRHAVAAASGNAEMSESFQRMGINAAEFANMPLEEKLLKMNEGFHASASRAMALSDTMNIMGKSGGEAIPLLSMATQELEEKMDSASVASGGVVKTLAELDDRIIAMKNGFAVVAAYIIAVFTAVTSSVSIQFMGLFDVISDGWSASVTVAIQAGKAIGLAMIGDFKGAGLAAQGFFTAAKGGYRQMANDAGKASIAARDAWKEAFDGSAPSKPTGPDVESVKAEAEAAAKEQEKIAEEQKKLSVEISSLEESARLRQLSLAEKILDADKRRHDLSQSMIDDPAPEKELQRKRDILKIDADLAELHKKDDEEKAKHEKEIGASRKEWAKLGREHELAGMSDSDKIKSLKTEQKRLNTEAKSAMSKGDEVTAIDKGKQSWAIEDKIKGLEEGIQKTRDKESSFDKKQAFDKMSDPEKVKSLTKDKQEKEKESKSAFSKGDEKTGIEKRIEAKEIGGQIDEISKKKQKNPSIQASSLADIGGGGGAKMLEGIDQQKKMVDLLSVIAANTAGGSTGSRPPEPI